MSSELALNTLMAHGSRWKRYPAYRDSGVEWLGEVPEEWKFTRLKYALKEKLKYGANESAELDDTNLPRYIRITDFGDDGKLKDDTFKSLPFEVAKDYLLQHGDILFARSGATVGKTFQFKKNDGLACFAGYLIKATPDENIILSDFLYFLTKSNLYEKWKNNIFIQATIQNIGADKYGLLPIFLPNINEQHAIAAFLDRETGRIDTLIEKKERQIELLQEKRAALISHAVTKGLDSNVKMKDSGVEWLGEIPEGWKLRKLKHVAKINLSNVDKKTKEDEDSVKLCNYVDVYKNDYINSDINFMEATASPNQIDKFALREGDVLITKDSESWEDIAVPAYISTDLEDVICGYHLAHIRPDHVVVNGEYIFRSFSAICLNYQFKVEANGITRFGIGKYPIDNSLFLVPPINEQKSIAAFLDRETGHIDTLTTKLHESISKLREYRTALISAAVTGKIDVRQEAA